MDDQYIITLADSSLRNQIKTPELCIANKNHAERVTLEKNIAT